MGLVPRFKPGDINKQLNLSVLEIERQLLVILDYTGVDFTQRAKDRVTETIYERKVFDNKGNVRSRRSWELTGHLKSSIGYFLLNNGVLVNQKFEGNPEGEKAAKELLATIPKSGYQLIVVAGMNYASYVESRGYDVITTSGEAIMVDLKKDVKRFEKLVNSKGYSYDFAMSSSVIEKVL
jgi:hypothetical protein